MQSSVYWCMVFGSTGMNNTHWRNLEHDEKEQIERRFRDGLVRELAITFNEWQAYWGDMLYFRNNYAAHRTGKYDRPVPSFELALRAAYFYDSWARDVIRPDVIAEPPLKNVARKFERALSPMLERIVESARAYEVEVNRV